MNLKKLKAIRKILLTARITRKRFVVRRATKKLGGAAVRNVERRKRFDAIKSEKYKIVEDLVRSWSLGELRHPTKEEHEKFFLYYHFLPWSYLMEIKKKYWHL